MVFRGGNYKIHVVVLNLPMHEPLSWPSTYVIKNQTTNYETEKSISNTKPLFGSFVIVFSSK